MELKGNGGGELHVESARSTDSIESDECLTAFGSRRLAKLIAGQQKRSADATALDGSTVDGTPFTSAASDGSFSSTDKATAFGSKRLGKLILGHKRRGLDSRASTFEVADSTTSCEEASEANIVGGGSDVGSLSCMEVATEPSGPAAESDASAMETHIAAATPGADAEARLENVAEDGAPTAESIITYGKAEAAQISHGIDPAEADATGSAPENSEAPASQEVGSFTHAFECSVEDRDVVARSRSLRSARWRPWWQVLAWHGLCSVSASVALSRSAPWVAAATVPMWLVGGVVMHSGRRL